MKFKIGRFLFDSDFDSGNLSKVIYEYTVESKLPALNGTSSLSINSASASVPKAKSVFFDHWFKLWTSPDAFHTLSPTKNRTWFHFSVTLESTAKMNEQSQQTILFEFMNLNRVQRLFNMGFRPVFRHECDPRWHQLPVAPLTKYVDGLMEMQFQFTYCSKIFVQEDFNSIIGTKRNPAPEGKYFFAYCLPYSYQKLQNELEILDKRFGPLKTKSHIPVPTINRNNRFYYHRDTLCYSIDKNKVDIITITSFDGSLSACENPPSELFTGDSRRSTLFNTDIFSKFHKTFFVVTSRVHPAETIASYMLDGFIEFITSQCATAQLLRSRYVFKIIPMLNPDGVVRGHYRGDSNGVNLNRVYDTPDPELHPTIWATKTYIEYLGQLGKVQWYIDFHGHANKPGSFLLGNWIPNLTKQYEMLKFARCCYLRNPLFDINECNFAPKGMLNPPSKDNNPEKTKDGTGRVAIYRSINSAHCYTFEANYYGIRSERRNLPNFPPSKEKRFSELDMRIMGKSIALAVFDMVFPNQSSPSIDSWAKDRLSALYAQARVALRKEDIELLKMILQRQRRLIYPLQKYFSSAHPKRRLNVSSTNEQLESKAVVGGPEPSYENIVSGYSIERLSNPFLFLHGGKIEKVDIAYETWGKLNPEKDNAILLHTGLSGSSHAKSHSANTRVGWWEKFIGPGLALDTDKFHIICTNVIGGCYGSTGPSSINPIDNQRYASNFPVVTIFDMVQAQFNMLDQMGIKRLHASVGSSMGGMQSLAAAAMYPERVGRLVSISAAARSHPYSIALRFAQRQVLMADPNWNRGFYYGGIYPHVGMKLARQIATVTYRSGPEWEERFGRVRSAPGTPRSFAPDYLIESYLDHQGEKFCHTYDPNSLLYISKAMDMFDMSYPLPHLGRKCNEQLPGESIYSTQKELVKGLLPVQMPALILGVQSDLLFPIWQQKEIADCLKNAGNSRVTYYEIDAKYGHDTFLMDTVNVGSAVKGHLEMH